MLLNFLAHFVSVVVYLKLGIEYADGFLFQRGRKRWIDNDEFGRHTVGEMTSFRVLPERGKWVR